MSIVSMAECLTSDTFAGFLVILYSAWFCGTWLAIFCCVGSHIAVAIWNFVDTYILYSFSSVTCFAD